MELLLILFTIFLLSVEGQQPFDPSTEICCNGTKHDISEYKNDYYPGCCGTKLLLEEKEGEISQMCCGGEIIDVADSDCCNGKKYNPDTFTCLNYVVAVEIPPTDKEKGRTSACGQSADDAKFYNATEQLCCQGNVTGRESSTYSCCGKLSYDYTNNECCNGTIVPKEAGKVSCCGQSLYDKKTHVCCIDKLYPLPPGGEQTDRSEMHILRKRGFSGKMMAPSSYCCGSEFFNKSTHLCCSKFNPDYTDLRSYREYKIYPVDEESKNSAQCCGIEVISTKTQACRLNEETLDKGAVIVRNCCGRKYQYDDNTRKWSRVALTSDVADEEWCRQLSSTIYIYGETTEMCDSNKWSEYKVGGPACYLHKDGITVSYNSTNQLCCPSGVVPKPDGVKPDAQCCDVDPPHSSGQQVF